MVNVSIGGIVMNILTIKRNLLQIRVGKIIKCTLIGSTSTIVLLFILFWINSMQYYQTSPNMFGLEFKYLIKNSCPKDSNVKAIHIVFSYAGHLKARSILRRAYPKEELNKLGIFRVFLLGIFQPGIKHNVSQEEILQENEQHHDLVQGNFIDVYRNLTYKHLMGLRYASSECEAEIIIKMDDDIVVDLYSLMKFIVAKQKNDIIGQLYNNTGFDRATTGKWLVTREEYADDFVPAYVIGMLYIIRSSAARKIVVASEDEKKFLWVDDAYVTGVLGQKAGVTFQNWTEIVNLDIVTGSECCLQKGEECWFIYGPNDHKYEVTIDFQQHFKLCSENKCKKIEQCPKRPDPHPDDSG